MKPSLSPDIVERYEVLRAHLLQGRWAQADHWRVVVQQGLLAWCQVAPNHPSPLTPPSPPSCSRAPVDLQTPVTHVLASMVLGLHLEVTDER